MFLARVVPNSKFFLLGIGNFFCNFCVLYLGKYSMLKSDETRPVIPASILLTRVKQDIGFADKNETFTDRSEIYTDQNERKKIKQKISKFILKLFLFFQISKYNRAFSCKNLHNSPL